MKRQKTSKSHLDLVTLILSVLAGAVWMYVGNILVDSLSGKLWMPLLMGLYFGLLALVLIGTAFLCTKARGFSMPVPGSYGKALLTALAILVAAGLFQLLYSMNVRVKTTGTSRSAYVFLIDDSGSISDPLRLREDAVRQVMADCDDDYPFAVYAFTDECWMLQDIQPASAAKNMRLGLRESGLTDIVKAINTVTNDISFGRLDAGAAPRIILVTDGASSEIGLRAALNKANQMNISICTIGMPGCDERMLQNIADLTDGTSVTVDTIDQLPSAMQSVAVSTSTFQRSLISVRDPAQMDWLYSLMRIVFLLILGAGYIYIKSLLLRSDDSDASMLLPNLVAVIVGALCVEVGMNIFFLNEQAMLLFMCVGFTILLTMVLNAGAKGQRTDRPGYEVGGAGGSGGQDDIWGDYGAPGQGSAKDDPYASYTGNTDDGYGSYGGDDGYGGDSYGSSYGDDSWS